MIKFRFHTEVWINNSLSCIFFNLTLYLPNQNMLSCDLRVISSIASRETRNGHTCPIPVQPVYDNVSSQQYHITSLLNASLSTSGPSCRVVFPAHNN
jgi:hypothetical protein